MMRRSSGELSSGLSGCGVRPSLGDLRGVVSAYLRGPCCGTPLACSHHIHLHAVSSQNLVYASCNRLCRRTSELLDCENPVPLALGGG